MARCQFNDLLAPGVEEWIGFDPDGGNTLLDERGEGGLEFSFAAGFGDVQLEPEPARGSLNLFHLRIGGRKARVKQATDHASLWDQFPQQFQPLRHHFQDEKHHARHIAAGAVEAGHEALADRVRSNHEDDRDRRRRRLCRPCRLRAAGSRDHGDRPARQLGRQRRQSISSAFGPAVIDADIAMLDIASLAQAAPERRNEVRELAGRFQAEKPDHRHRRLLRARRRWPSRRTAAEKRDKFPPPHGAYPKAKDRGLSIAGSWSAFRGRASQQKRPAHVRYGSMLLKKSSMISPNPSDGAFLGRFSSRPALAS